MQSIAVQQEDTVTKTENEVHFEYDRATHAAILPRALQPTCRKIFVASEQRLQTKFSKWIQRSFRLHTIKRLGTYICAKES